MEQITRSLFGDYTFGRYIINSAVVALCATFLVLFLGTLAGYALARFPIRGKFPLMVSLLIISVFPEIAVIAPLYLLMRDLGWLNSYQALIVPYTAFFLPFAIWILRNYFLGIPYAMEESARIDGAGPLRTLWTVILPQATPGLFTAAVFTFTACWSEFLMALSFNIDNNYRTIPVGIAEFGSQFTVPYGTLFRGQRGGRRPYSHPGARLPQGGRVRPHLGGREGVRGLRPACAGPPERTCRSGTPA